MPKCLTAAQAEQYREEGCVFPIRVISEIEAAELRGRLEAFERRTGGPLKGDMRHKSHLLFAWLAEVVRSRSNLDTVENLLGPTPAFAGASLAGLPTSSSKRRPIRPLCRGTSTRPIGA